MQTPSTAQIQTPTDLLEVKVTHDYPYPHKGHMILEAKLCDIFKGEESEELVYCIQFYLDGHFGDADFADSFIWVKRSQFELI